MGYGTLPAALKGFFSSWKRSPPVDFASMNSLVSEASVASSNSVKKPAGKSGVSSSRATARSAGATPVLDGRWHDLFRLNEHVGGKEDAPPDFCAKKTYERTHRVSQVLHTMLPMMRIESSAEKMAKGLTELWAKIPLEPLKPFGPTRMTWDFIG